MFVNVECPSCGKSLCAEERLIGKRVRCRSCASTFVVESDRPEEEPEEPPVRKRDIQRRDARSVAGDPPRREEDWEEPRVRRRAIRHRNGGGQAIAALVLGILAMVAWCVPLIGFPMSITGLVLGIIGQRSRHPGMAAAGIALSSIGLVLTLVNAGLGFYLAVSGHPLVR